MYRNRVWWILLICLLIPAALAITVSAFVAEAPGDQVQISLNGDRMVTLQYGESYTDPGAVATIIDNETGEETPTELIVSGTVDAGKTGVYTVRYTASANGRIYTAYRRVRVLDGEMPVINLISDPDYYTLPGRARYSVQSPGIGVSILFGTVLAT